MSAVGLMVLEILSPVTSKSVGYSPGFSRCPKIEFWKMNILYMYSYVKFDEEFNAAFIFTLRSKLTEILTDLSVIFGHKEYMG